MKKLILILSVFFAFSTAFAQNYETINKQFFNADTITADTNYSLPMAFNAIYDYSIAVVCAVGANSTQVAKIYIQGSNDDCKDYNSVDSDSWYNIDTLSVASSAMTIENGLSSGTNFKGKWLRIKYDVTTNGSSKVSGWLMAKRKVYK